MNRLSKDYRKNVALLDRLLRVKENFDIIKKPLAMGRDELTFYYIDGFVKDAVMQKMMIYFLSVGKLGEGADAAQTFLDAHVPYVETELCESVDTLTQMMLSGAVVMLGSSFGDRAILIDARTYPARETSEPQNDRVMLGARDGFVETLIFNTALIRRRIRDTSLTMKYITVGEKSRTDVVLCYMSDRADGAFVDHIEKKLTAIKTEALPMGHQSLSECLIRSRWYNPFPKIRTTERPDAAAAQLLEGSVMILVDNSPEVMILPTSIFDFMQETNDYYFPPLTGTYLRLVRQLVLVLALLFTPTWYLLLRHAEWIPGALSFLIPQEPGELPIILQLFLAELAIDGLKLASMNTPDRLSNSMSVVGGLILGDFAVKAGWLSGDVILYMALVAVAGFAQQNYELGYAIKFMRMLLLILVALLDVYGYGIGLLCVLVLIVTNKTLTSDRGYLYPLLPFDGRALLRLLIRVPKNDRGKIKNRKKKQKTS